MYRWVRVLSLKGEFEQGELGEALQLVKEIAGYMSEHHFPTKVFMAEFGEDVFGKVYFMADFESLAEYNENVPKVYGDEGFQAFNKRAYKYFRVERCGFR